MQNPMDLLDMEKRTGVKETDIDDFLRKTTDLEAAIRGMADGTIKPEDVRVEGIDTPEEAEEKVRAKAARIAESKRKAEELRLKRAAEEKERWWGGAEFCGDRKVKDADGSVVVDIGDAAAEKLELQKQRYNFDYSRWNDWTPTDSATLEEIEQKEAEVEAIKNKEFESNNAEWCEGFTADMEKRNKGIEEKKANAEDCRNKGNKRFKRKEWDLALEQYMNSLKLQPYEVKTLTNIAQVYIKKGQLDDCLEFLARTLYVYIYYIHVCVCVCVCVSLFTLTPPPLPGTTGIWTTSTARR